MKRQTGSPVRRSAWPSALAGVVAIGAMGSLCCTPAQAGSDQPVNISQKLAAYEDLLSLASTPRQKSAILDALDATARDVFAQGRPASGAFILNAANTLRMHGHEREALDLFDKVIETPESPRQRLSALNSRATFGKAIFPERPDEYVPFFTELMQHLDGDGKDILPDTYAQQMFLSAASQLAGSFRRIDDPAELGRIAEVIDWALDRDWIDWSGEFGPDAKSDFDANLTVAMFLNAARLYDHLGETTKAQAMRERVLSDRDDWGRLSSFRPGVRLAKARAGEPVGTDNPKVIENLHRLWNDPEIREAPQALSVASDLTSALRSAGALDQAAVIAIDASNLYIKNEQAWDEAARWHGQEQRKWVGKVNRQRVAGMMHGLLHDPRWQEYAEELLPVADAFLDHFADNNLAHSVKRQRQRINAYLASQ